MSGPSAAARDGRPRVLVLCRNVASNALGRSYLLAKLLRDDFDVRITGPSPAGGGIWPPCPGDVPIDVWCDHMPGLRELHAQSGRLRADVLVACKARRDSYGLALLARRRLGIPMVLDIDEWDVPGGGRTAFVKWLRTLLRPWKWWRLWELAFDLLATRADALTMATTFVQRRYGGELLPHVRDVSELDPARVKGDSARLRLGLGGSRIVLFLGTPRRHKGVEDVGKALGILGRDDVRFVIAGADVENKYVRKLPERIPSVVLHPQCAWSEVPSFLAAADVVVVPQRDGNFARTQLPAKLVDAMAMGRPIVATAVSDIPMYLEGCGRVVRPGDIKGMAAALGWVLDHPAEAEEMGRRARARAVKDLSYEAGRPVLVRAVEKALSRRRRRA